MEPWMDGQECHICSADYVFRRQCSQTDDRNGTMDGRNLYQWLASNEAFKTLWMGETEPWMDESSSVAYINEPSKTLWMGEWSHG
jgi:hypothetical protein